MASTPAALVLTGTLRYPHARLIELGRLILINYESHLKAQKAAAATADDEDAMWEAADNLDDVNAITWLVDRKRWMEENEAKNIPFPEFTGNAWKEEALKDPKQAENSLLTMGVDSDKAQYVIPDAVKLRKEKRSDPPEGSWKNEDALLDLLEFLSKSDHSSLFRATED